MQVNQTNGYMDTLMNKWKLKRKINVDEFIRFTIIYHSQIKKMKLYSSGYDMKYKPFKDLVLIGQW